MSPPPGVCCFTTMAGILSEKPEVILFLVQSVQVKPVALKPKQVHQNCQFFYCQITQSHGGGKHTLAILLQLFITAK